MIRKTIATLIALAPFNALRIFLYRTLLGYKICDGCHIGMFNYINVETCSIGKATIGLFNVVEVGELVMADGSRILKKNRFRSFNRLHLREGSLVRANNVFLGTVPGLTPFKKHENMYVGKDSIITAGHLFDLSDTITLGDNVTVGGMGSQLWTHSFSLDHIKMQAPIIIGDDVYIGSRSVITPGVSIAGKVSVGAGTTVSKSIKEPGFYVSSSLIRKGDVSDYSTENFLVHNGAKFFRRGYSDSQEG
jgi:acetyltransferase-like isoleucine patch superfamily enzyme